MIKVRLPVCPYESSRRHKNFHIQGITLFRAGDRDEAIRHVNALITRSPAVKEPCAFVQASGAL